MPKTEAEKKLARQVAQRKYYEKQKARDEKDKTVRLLKCETLAEKEETIQLLKQHNALLKARVKALERNKPQMMVILPGFKHYYLVDDSGNEC